MTVEIVAGEKSYCCPFEKCGCKIIKLEGAPKVTLPINVLDTFQLMQHKDSLDIETKTTEFLLIKDVWDFDNIGVSKDLPSIKDISEEFTFEEKTWKIIKHVKYLICADCDKGPIGIVCSISNGEQELTVYMLSLSSVSSI